MNLFLCVLLFQEVPHGVLCFVPSYTTLSKPKTRWEVSKPFLPLSLSFSHHYLFLTLTLSFTHSNTHTLFLSKGVIHYCEFMLNQVYIIGFMLNKLPEVLLIDKNIWSVIVFCL